MQVAAALGWPIKRQLQQVAQQGHHPQEHRPITHWRQAAMNGAPRVLSGRARRQLDRRRTGHSTAKAIGLQPGQIAPDGIGISKTLPVQPGQKGSGPVRQVSFWQGREDRLQLLSAGGIACGQIGPAAQQLDQVEQALQVQQARIAMALQLAFTVGGGADAPVQPGQLRLQHRS